MNCLVCLGQLLEYMDKWYVQDEIFPILQAVPSREPAVLMSCLGEATFSVSNTTPFHMLQENLDDITLGLWLSGIFKVALSHDKLGISKDVMANKVLPFLIPLSIDSNLNLSQVHVVLHVSFTISECISLM